MVKNKLYYSLCMCLGLISLAHAQHESRIEEITVKARPDSSQSIDHIAQPVSILKGDELWEKVSNTLGETLSQELGVSASDFGQGSSRPVIRGLSGPRVRVLQNGLGSMDLSTISVDHAVTLEPVNAEQIEVLRGPSTLLFGSGASGGVVNISNNRIHEQLPEPFSVTLNASYNSVANAKMLGVSSDAAIKNIGFHFDILTRMADNYDTRVGEILNSRVETDDINAGISFISNQKGFLGVAYGRYETVYEIPFNPDDPDELVFIDQAQDRIDIAGKINKPVKGLKSVRLRVGNVDYGHTEFEGPGEPGTVFRNDEWEGRLELQHQPIKQWDGTMGVQYRNRSFSAIGDEAFVPGTKLRSIGIFLLEDRDWRDWHFELGVRLEKQKAEPQITSGFVDTKHDAYSVSAGTVWHFNRTHALGFSLTRSQRAPSIEELFSNGPHLSTGTFEEGSSDLDVETSNNLDVSLRREHDKINWTINLFVNYIEDYIFQLEQDENGDGIADKVNENRILGGELLLVNFEQDDAVFYGMEAELLTTLIKTDRYSIDTRIWGDLVRAELIGSKNLPRISPARLGGSLEYNIGNLHADVDLINVFSQNKVASLESVTDGYVLLNAGISYTLNKKTSTTTFSFKATNLLDEDARRHTSFLKERAPLPGRAFIVSIRLNF